MKDTAYAYAVARLRAVENSLLGQSDTELLLSSKSIDECMRILADKGYTSKDASTSLSGIFAAKTAEMWQLVREVAPQPEMFDIFLYKNDFHNMKVILKGLTSGKPYEHLIMSPHTVDTESMKKAVSSGKFDLLPEMMAQSAEAAYTALAKDGDVQAASVILDKASLLAFYNGAKAAKSDFLIKLAALTIENANVKTALRCSKIGKDAAFTEKCLIRTDICDPAPLALAAANGYTAVCEHLAGGKYSKMLDEANGDFSVFEKLCDNLVMSLVSDAKYTAFGIKPIVAYILAKETEIKAAHIIAAGKKSGLDTELVRGRLRMLYV